MSMNLRRQRSILKNTFLLHTNLIIRILNYENNLDFDILVFRLQYFLIGYRCNKLEH